MDVSEGTAQARYLRLGVLTGVFHGVNRYLVVGNGRAVAPNLVQRVEIGAHGDAALLAQVMDERLHGLGVAAHAVDAHLCVLVAELAAEPLRDGRRALDLELHQLEGSTVELFGGSEEIAAVGPQRSLVQGHHGGTCRTVETTDPLAALPARGRIFTVVGIGAGEDEGVEMLTAQHLTQRRQTLKNSRVFHNIQCGVNNSYIQR